MGRGTHRSREEGGASRRSASPTWSPPTQSTYQSRPGSLISKVRAQDPIKRTCAVSKKSPNYTNHQSSHPDHKLAKEKRTCASQIGKTVGETHANPCSNPMTAYSESGELTISIDPGVPFVPAGGEIWRLWRGTVVRVECWSETTAWRWENVPCDRN